MFSMYFSANTPGLGLMDVRPAVWDRLKVCEIVLRETHSETLSGSVTYFATTIGEKDVNLCSSWLLVASKMPAAPPRLSHRIGGGDPPTVRLPKHFSLECVPLDVPLHWIHTCSDRIVSPLPMVNSLTAVCAATEVVIAFIGRINAVVIHVLVAVICAVTFAGEPSLRHLLWRDSAGGQCTPSGATIRSCSR